MAKDMEERRKEDGSREEKDSATGSKEAKAKPEEVKAKERGTAKEKEKAKDCMSWIYGGVQEEVSGADGLVGMTGRFGH